MPADEDPVPIPPVIPDVVVNPFHSVRDIINLIAPGDAWLEPIIDERDSDSL